MSGKELGKLATKPIVSIVHLVGILCTWGAIAYSYGGLNNRVGVLEKNEIKRAESCEKKVSEIDQDFVFARGERQTLKETCVKLSSNSENTNKSLDRIFRLIDERFPKTP